MTDKTKGMCWALLSNMLMGVMLILIRIASEDYHPFFIVFFRNFFALLIMLIWVIPLGYSSLKTNQLPLYFYRSLIGVIAMMSWFYGLANLKISFATALSFTAPIFTAIAAAIYLKDKMHIRRWSAVIIGFIGTIIIINPGHNNVNHVIFVVIGSTMLWAVTAIIIKNLTKTESSTSITFYMVLFMTPMSLPFALFYWQEVYIYDWLILIAIGAISNLSYFTLTKAMSSTELSNILPIDFTKLIFVSVFAWILFDEHLTTNEIVGSAIIISSNIYIAYREKLQRAKTIASDLEPPCIITT
ncbi:MAG: DMT family transporter [Rickettsiales bacterium]|jgi:drug/metabolite transporter (DMT)-like permease|nr:DMT family transporter [Rickettsiales bacterium]